jgi:hypothetical protein
MEIMLKLKSCQLRNLRKGWHQALILAKVLMCHRSGSKGNHSKTKILPAKKPSQGWASGFNPCEGFDTP